MRGLLAAIQIGLLDMRGDLRRFGLLIACLAVGTALIAGVSSVGTSIRQAVETNAAFLMGGDVEAMRTDRVATPAELGAMQSFGSVASVVDTNVRASANDRDAFVDLVSIGPRYPLLGRIDSPQLAADAAPFDQLGLRDGRFGALVSPLMLQQLGIAVGNEISLGGTPLEVRGVLNGLPDGAMRGFRLGLPAVISSDALAVLSDRTSPLPGLGTNFRYKVRLDTLDPEAGKIAIRDALNDTGWVIKTARDGLGPMVHYYDLFIRFLVIVGLASLLIGGVSVWTGISAYIAERAQVVAVMRSMGATRARVFIHFFVQVFALTAIGVGLGLLVGAGVAQLALPVVARAVGIDLPSALHVAPLLTAAGIGAVTAFAFSFLPLQQAQSVRPIALFRAGASETAPIGWRSLMGWSLVPLALSVAAFLWLATAMTGDFGLVVTFSLISAVAVVLFRFAIAAARGTLARMPEPTNRLMRYALRGIAAPGSNAPSIVVSAGTAVATLVVVLVLQTNLSNEYLGASVFDAPTVVASDLFEDEVATLQAMQQEGSEIASFTSTPMLRGELVRIGDAPVDRQRAEGTEALFLLSGEIPLTYRSVLPPTSKVTAGSWWPADYSGPPLVSLHDSLRAGLGLKLGDKLTFSIFGEDITAEIGNFREYSWQGGIDFLATFSPGVLEGYPSTLLAAVTAKPGLEKALEGRLAEALPDVRFIAIGDTLELITASLTQLSLAASLVGGLAVGNGLLVLIGALATGQRRREADAVVTKVLGSTGFEITTLVLVQYGLMAAFAALLATPLGIGLAYLLTRQMLSVGFVASTPVVAALTLGSVVLTAGLAALTLRRALTVRPALLLREMR